LLILSISKSFATNINIENGITSLMYHRFDENKYPSTNIKSKVFINHLDEINNENIEFINFSKFKKIIKEGINKNYILLTIDDGFESFFINAWPILKSKKIPFVLFVSTREVGNNGYMTWDQIREIDKSSLVTIGNHSHSHDYLIDWDKQKIKLDLNNSINIFKKELGYSPNLFSYPFGEYSLGLKKIVSDLNFEFAFGQHSGVIDSTKDFLSLPRFPINEKYGELKRFKSLLKTLPFPYKNITPENRYLEKNENPPEVKIKFFENLINIENINCYSNEGNVWRKSEIKFLSTNELSVVIKEKFTSERGRINCSLQENNGKWRWLGIQYVIKEY
jgi:poly-beta-1,6-N-acetyl-D-glucosamine N-deacetylase